MDKQDKGKLGEDAVCEMLRKKGHEILSRNYRKRVGEIDIISRKDGFIVFTEVKTRKRNSCYNGLEAVDERKRVKIVLTADAYLTEYQPVLQPRYDICEVEITQGKAPHVISIHHYEDAFTADGVYTVN